MGPPGNLLKSSYYSTLPSKINLWEGKLFITSGPSRYIYVLLLQSSKLVIHLLKAMGHRFFTNCLMDPHVIRWALLHLRRCSDFDTISFARCTTILGQLLQIHYNRIRWTNSKEMLLQCIILSYCRVRNKVFTLEEKHKPMPPGTSPFGC